MNSLSENSSTALSFEAMGCRFEVLIGTERSVLSRFECAAACEEVRDLVLDWHARLSVFDPRSIVSEINRSKSGVAVSLDSDMFELCRLCERMRARTDGAFNIAAGTLMHAHGFRDRIGEDLDGLSIDDVFVLDEESQTLTKSDDRIMLDFGAIAKGFVLDLIRDELAELGVKNAFVHGGTSSVLAVGLDSDERAWTSRVGDGVDVVLRDLAMGVSEIGGRVVEVDGRVDGHVMDPRAMGPARNGVSRVVCIHESGAVADAYSTACSVSPELATRLIDDPCTLIVFDKDSTVTMHDPLRVVRSSPEDHHDRD